MTSKDGKSLIPALVNFMEGFQTKITDVITEIKEEFMAICNSKDEEISALRSELKSVKKDCEKLSEKIEENEAYERRDTLIFSGKKLPVVQNDENCANLVCGLLSENLNLVLSASDISVAHRLGPKPSNQVPDNRAIIAKFCRRDSKINVISSARRVKPNDLYVNESLTPTRQKIAAALRKAKKECPTIVSGTTSIDGSVYVWTKPSNPGAREFKTKINTLAKLQDFCTITLKKQMTHFLLK